MSAVDQLKQQNSALQSSVGNLSKVAQGTGQTAKKTATSTGTKATPVKKSAISAIDSTENATAPVRRAPRKLNAGGGGGGAISAPAQPKAPTLAKATPVKARTPLGTQKILPVRSSDKPAVSSAPAKKTPVTAAKTPVSSASKTMSATSKHTAVKKDTLSAVPPKPVSAEKKTPIKTPVKKNPAQPVNPDGKCISPSPQPTH
ncbi:hypothetical protein BDU57DRAFT_520729 [Ampelomyces quisqualis]|uniref:Uncharacterized protein n=1 Tax=Ampelomyces quisqualis TaxID=50730 RepID=A0A6A5QGW4_AMPQU|nr:hypothetical protein BDU57DRAFT_520729 [Ampelomyces quisqualis]